MSINKNAQLRYKILDECLSNRYKKYFIEDLINTCSEQLSNHYGRETKVSRRQILEDLKFIESVEGYNASIYRYKEGRRVYYRYEDINFSIYKKVFSEQELETIEEAINIFSNIQGLDWTDTLNTKLSAALNLNKQEKRVIDFEENKFLKGLKFLNPLYHYTINSQCINIKYKPFNEEVQNYIISPYYIKQYNNRWFLLGKNHKEDYLQTIPLDRIINITPSNESYIENSIDFEIYFDEIIGITNFENRYIQTIKIKLSDRIIPYIESKPIHSTQRISENILSVDVKINYELESLILSFGENMQVLEPLELKNKIKERLEITVNQYNKDKN